MKKPPLKTGERVRVYGNSVIGTETNGKVCVVTDAAPDDDGFITVSMGDEFGISVHPKQCRRLKPKAAKPKEERLKVDISIREHSGELRGAHLSGRPHTETLGAFYSDNKTVRLVELRDSERIVSREDLARAFGLAYAQANPSQILDTRLFNKLVTALGFPEETK